MNSTKTITIDPVTRVEGHGRVTVELGPSGEVADAYFQTVEFRGFEKFCEGRMLWDMPNITSRVCGICPVSHHLASVKACEAVLNVEPPKAAKMLRELLHMGQMVQSHALHFFYLGMPDFFKKELAPEERNIFGLIDKNNGFATSAIKLRKVGQTIVDRVGGGRLHPVTCIPGGLSRPLPYVDRIELHEAVVAGIRIAQQAMTLVKDLHTKNHDTFGRFASFPSSSMGMVSGDKLELYDGPIRIMDAAGETTVQFNAAEYTKHIEEESDPRSWMKGVYLKGKGARDGLYRVGPLARINIAKTASTPLANAKIAALKQLGGSKPLQPSLFYHYARMIELLYALERARELLKDPDIMSAEVRVPVEKKAGEGVGAIEAPRGTLFHHYWTNDDGRITKANLVVSTAHNKGAMNASVKQVAETLVQGDKLKEGELDALEMAIRCYDPCLSCSTHAIGQMPLEVVLQQHDGTVLHHVRYPDCDA